MLTNKERSKLIAKANTEALKRLRREFHNDYRTFYKEELEKLGVSIRPHITDKRVAELQDEIVRLNQLLEEKGVA